MRLEREKGHRNENKNSCPAMSRPIAVIIPRDFFHFPHPTRFHRLAESQSDNKPQRHSMTSYESGRKHFDSQKLFPVSGCVSVWVCVSV